MENERSAVITLRGQEYELLLTTRAAKVISKRYGGLEQLGDKFMKADSFEGVLEEIIWLLVVLSNQTTMLYNLDHADAPKPLLTEERLELLTTPLDLADYKDAIVAAMNKGVKRNVESEPPEPGEGNAQAE